MSTLIATALALAAAAPLGTIVALIRRDGGPAPAEPAPAEPAPAEPAPAAAEQPDTTDETPAPPVDGGERRRLADDWRDQLSPLDPPELEHRHLMVRPYVSKHHEDTVEIVTGYWPLVGRARVRAALDTEVMPAVRS
ncbi:hypothetical protein ACFHW1_05120 [Micromonospora sp. LOL_014]|uniref:hypothetical protein n=1 Tax=Micromonospora sp. LOL_014 TaxID=3345415 RepID=UPI003A890F1E